MTEINELAEFIFPITNQPVRIVDRDGNPWFIAKDVCDILEIQNVSQALNILDDDERGICSNIYTIGGNQNMAVVSEPGLYSLILRSRKPQAKQFKRWVTHEVLPVIRKTGKIETVKPLRETHVKRIGKPQDRVYETEIRQVVWTNGSMPKAFVKGVYWAYWPKKKLLKVGMGDIKGRLQNHMGNHGKTSHFGFMKTIRYDMDRLEDLLINSVRKFNPLNPKSKEWRRVDSLSDVLEAIGSLEFDFLSDKGILELEQHDKEWAEDLKNLFMGKFMPDTCSSVSEQRIEEWEKSMKVLMEETMPQLKESVKAMMEESLSLQPIAEMAKAAVTTYLESNPLPVQAPSELETEHRILVLEYEKLLLDYMGKCDELKSAQDTIAKLRSELYSLKQGTFDFFSRN